MLSSEGGRDARTGQDHRSGARRRDARCRPGSRAARLVEIPAPGTHASDPHETLDRAGAHSRAASYMTTSSGSAIKRALLGRRLATEEAGHQLLPKVLALPVFASDALSSNAYATEEILLVLITAGTGAITRTIPIAVAVATLMIIVITSYRQTVMAYPKGGGSYIVTKENVGITPGLVAGGALLTDYVLTVAVSVAAGAFAVASLVPSLLNHRVALALGFIAFVTIMNLRGVKESGTLFAVPTYAFIVAVVATLVVGTVRCLASGCPEAEIAEATRGLEDEAFPVVNSLSLFVILRAF